MNEIFRIFTGNSKRLTDLRGREFIESLSGRLHLEAGETERLSAALAGEMIEALKAGDQVSVHGFGTFQVRKRNERIIVNPKTRQKLLVPPRLLLVFHPSNTLKVRLNSVPSEEHK